MYTYTYTRGVRVAHARGLCASRECRRNVHDIYIYIYIYNMTVYVNMQHLLDHNSHIPYCTVIHRMCIYIIYVYTHTYIDIAKTGSGKGEGA